MPSCDDLPRYVAEPRWSVLLAATPTMTRTIANISKPGHARLHIKRCDRSSVNGIGGYGEGHHRGVRSPASALGVRAQLAPRVVHPAQHPVGGAGLGQGPRLVEVAGHP